MSLGSRKRFFLTLVRHGETELNRQGIVQGQGIDPALNETGKSQAEALGKWLSEETYTHIYSSDLLRARQTCEIIMSENLSWKSTESLKVAGESPVIFETRMRERCYGMMEGRKREEYEKLARASGKSVATFIPDGAETIQELGCRAVDFFNDLCKTCFEHSTVCTKTGAVQVNQAEKDSLSAPNVLVVSHGRLLATLFTRFSENYGCVFPPGKLGVVSVNTGRSCFDIEFTKHFESEQNSPNVGHCDKIKMKCTMLGNGDHLPKRTQE